MVLGARRLSKALTSQKWFPEGHGVIRKAMFPDFEVVVAGIRKKGQFGRQVSAW